MCSSTATMRGCAPRVAPSVSPEREHARVSIASERPTLSISGGVHAWLGGLSAYAYERALSALAGGWVRIYEPWVTEWMASAPEPLRSWLTERLARAAGLDLAGLRLCSGRGWQREGDRRWPDLLLVDESGGAIRVVIEAKAWAAVNGGLGYCTRRPDLPCCQPLCYVHGCWTDEDLSGAVFLLLAPKSRQAHFASWREWAAGVHSIGGTKDPWLFLDLGAVFQEVAQLARSGNGELATQAAALTHLLGGWYWEDIPSGVPYLAGS